MGGLEFFKKRHNVENKDMLKKGENFIQEFISRKKKVRSIKQFVENGLIANGGDYEDIKNKLISIYNFSKHTQEYGVKCDLSRIDETLRDFFSEQRDIKFKPLENAPHTAFYSKRDGYNRYNYRGVTVLQDDNLNPIMYFGRRNENSETHKKDSLFIFGENFVVLQDQYKANYDEIPLFGTGTCAEFNFDKDNKITSIRYKYLSHPRLGFWSDEEVLEFDKSYNDIKLIAESSSNCNSVD